MTKDYWKLAERLNNCYAEMAYNLNRHYYGDSNVTPKQKPSRFKIYRDRIRDAWNVLIGREHIGGDW